MITQWNTTSDQCLRNWTPAKVSLQKAEETLINQAMNGDLDAFNELVLKYQDVAYHHALAILRDANQAEDATQESFIKAFQNINGFRCGSFRGWIMKIVTNSAYDILRRAKRHPTEPLFPEDKDGEEMESPKWLADTSTSVQATVEQHEFSNQIYQLLDELPVAYCSVITLIDINEFDYSEAAKILQVPIGTVKSRLVRGRLQMQEKLRGGFEHSRKT
jgi:RNA polymerase sigma-70 factor (ECF subfamily)